MTTAKLSIYFLTLFLIFLITEAPSQMSTNQNQAPASPRQRIRELGVKVGILPTGQLNAITDVEGVLVGNTTLSRGDNIRTGVTAILPHSGNIFREKVPGSVFVGNGFGKLAGSAQVTNLERSKHRYCSHPRSVSHASLMLYSITCSRFREMKKCCR